MRSTGLVYRAVRPFRLVALVALASAECRLFDGSVSTQVQWRTALANGSGGWDGAPAVSGDTVVGLSGSSAVAFDLHSGAQLWQTVIKAGPTPAARSVATRDDRVFVADVPLVTALSLKTGQVLWTFQPDAQADRSEVAVDDYAVYLGTRSHRVYALDPASGGLRWSVDIGPGWLYLGIVTGVTVAGDTAYVAAEEWTSVNGTTRTGHIVALNRKTGTELWRYRGVDQPENNVSAAPRVVGHLILAPDLSDRGFFAIDRATGREVWRVRTPAGSFGALHAPVQLDGVVYGGTQGGVYAVDLETGALRWKREDLVGANDVAVCGSILLSQNQFVQVLDPKSGASISAFLNNSRLDFPTSDFAVSGNRAFVIGNTAAYGITCAP